MEFVEAWQRVKEVRWGRGWVCFVEENDRGRHDFRRCRGRTSNPSKRHQRRCCRGRRCFRSAYLLLHCCCRTHHYSRIISELHSHTPLSSLLPIPIPSKLSQAIITAAAAASRLPYAFSLSLTPPLTPPCLPDTAHETETKRKRRACQQTTLTHSPLAIAAAISALPYTSPFPTPSPSSLLLCFLFLQARCALGAHAMGYQQAIRSHYPLPRHFLLTAWLTDYGDHWRRGRRASFHVVGWFSYCIPIDLILLALFSALPCN